MSAADVSRPAAPRRSELPASLTNVTAVLGPTNTGKTHYAVERMLGHESGMIGLPLRLLAREIYDRVCQVRSPKAVALVTGEEKIVPENPSYWVCTVEAMPLDKRVAFLAVDEIQLCADPERGHTFTSRLFHARGQLETLFLGAATMRPVLRELLPGIQFLQRSRLSQLSYSGERKVSRLPRRSAIVAFSADQVYGVAELMRRQRGGAAVVMGALSPRTRNAQVALYQSGEVDFIVATDAIGMGLNMDIDHVAFAARRKYDGHGYRELRSHELAQIAGRAGRYMNDGTFGVTGEAPAFDPETVDQVENHRFDAVRLLQWRADDIDFSSIPAMIESLEVSPTTRGLLRAKPAVDLISLRHMSANREIEQRVTDESRARLLWSVCQIPDFQQTLIDDHVRLLTNIFVHLTDNDGRLPEDWLAGHVERLDNTEGDIDTLSARLAYVRTWTFVSNRSSWLDNAQHWQDKARDIEDRLSDALHEELTQRFIDRRTSVLMRRLSQEDVLDALVDEDGEVTIEGEFIGRLSGLQFAFDPRATEAKGALEAKALRGAATKAMEPFVYRAAAHIRAASKDEISLKDQAVLVFDGHPIARLKQGPSPLKPRVELIASEMVADLLGAEGRAALISHLESWTSRHVEEVLAQLVALAKAVDEEASDFGDGPIPLGAERKTGLNGLARGIGYQLLEHFGALERAPVAEQVKALSGEDRAQLRDHGVRFGEFSIYMPSLLKPAQARLLVLLWGVHSGLTQTPEGLPVPPSSGLTSAALDPAWSDGFLSAAGFRRCGPRAVRLDILERIGNLIRKQRFPEPDKPAKPAPRPTAPAETTPQAASETPGEPQAAQAPDAEAQAAASEQPAEATQQTPATEQAPAEPPVENVAEPSVATEPAPAEPAAAEPQGPAPFKPRPGAFQVTPDMLSLAGCSAPDFDEVLKGLGYRKITVNDEAGAEHQIWRPARPHDERTQRRPQRGKPHRQSGKGKPNRQSAKLPASADRASGPAGQSTAGPSEAGEGRPAHGTQPNVQKPRGERRGKPPKHAQRPPRQPTYDKDSPFAVLAQLKSNMKPNER